jgi:hypothetical protein
VGCRSRRPIRLRCGASNDVEERFVDFIYQPIVETDGVVSGIFVEGFDVTDRQEAESALRELNATLEARVEERSRELAVAEDELRQAQKMEAIGQFPAATGAAKRAPRSPIDCWPLHGANHLSPRPPTSIGGFLPRCFQ